MTSETAFDPKGKLLFQAEKLAQFAKGDLSFSPAMCEISPTNDCNARCDWCFYVSSTYKAHHSKEELPAENMLDLLMDLAEMEVPALTWTGGGDPSVYSHIDWAIATAHKMGLKQGMFTNAYKAIAEPELLEWIRITITERFVITKYVAKYAEKSRVGVNFNVTLENSSQLLSMAKAARDAGVRYFQCRPALADRWDLQKEIPMPTYLKSLETERFKVILTPYKFDDYLRPHGYPACYGHVLSPFVWYDGTVSVCAYHKNNHDYDFGNIRDTSFREVWEGVRRKKMLADGIPVINDCQNCCKLHETNKVLAAIQNEYPKPDNVEFI